MKYPYHPDHEPLHLADINYTYEPGPRPDRLRAIATLYSYDFIQPSSMDTDYLCSVRRKDGYLVGRARGASVEEVRFAAREMAGKDFDSLPQEVVADIDCRRLKAS